MLNKLKIKFSDWSTYEILWLFVSSGVILALSLIWKDTLLGTISAIAGILSVVLCAKGKISYLYYGIIQCVTYGYIAYTYGLYGESMLNLLFYFPANIFTFFIWKRNLKRKEESISGEDVHMRKLTSKQYIILTLVVIISSVIYGYFLSHIGAQQVRLDSFAVILSIVGQFLLTFRYVDQWIVWILVNLLSVVLWVIALATSGGGDYGILVMWIAFLVNSIYGYVNWNRIAKRELVNE